MRKKVSMLSVIVPFFNGNLYIKRLLKSVKEIAFLCKENGNIKLELIIVNDSPLVEIELPEENDILPIVITNEYNVGIHGSRLKGLEKAKGDWVLFLDQDDELMTEGFMNQLNLTEVADVVIGNGLYQYGDNKVPIYKNYASMKSLIQKRWFLEIRNLIPSPGECLIKKDSIPTYWKNVELCNNGSDDWLLWLLLFNENNVFACNNEYVYIHNDSFGNNLSLDLEKMYKSSLEMCELLEKHTVFPKSELRILRKAIDFKFYQDTKQLSIQSVLKYLDIIGANVKYKLILMSKR